MDFTPEQISHIHEIYSRYESEYHLEEANRDSKAAYVFRSKSQRRLALILIAHSKDNITVEREGSEGRVIMSPDDALQQLEKWLIENLPVEDIEEIQFLKVRHALSNSDHDRRLIEEGYHCQGLIGYAEGTDSKNNTLLQAFFLSASTELDYLYTAEPNDEDLSGRPVEKRPPLGYVVTSGAVENKGLKLHRFFRKPDSPQKVFDHFYCTNPKKELITQAGYREEWNDKYFLVKTSKEKGDEPLYTYSTHPQILLFDPIQDNQQDKGKEKLIQSSIDSAKGFWWLNDSEGRWSSKAVSDGGAKTLQIGPISDTELNPDDLIISNNGSQLQGIFKVSEVVADYIECFGLYEFREKIVISELYKNNYLIEQGFVEHHEKIFLELSRDVFLEIINTTELKFTGEQPDVKLAEEDNIPFHLDQVEETDRLNREPVAKSIAKLLNQQIFSTSLRKPFLKRSWIRVLRILRLNKLDKVIRTGWAKTISKWVDGSSQQIHGEKKSRHAFMIHLQGAWGDGKSTFLNLIKTNLNTEKQKWVVVNFNAWQHQHISPPWWSFLDQVYKQTLDQFPPIRRVWLYVREQYRRLFKTTLIGRALRFLILIGFLFIAFRFLPLILEFFGKGGQNTNPLGDDLIALSTILTTLAAIAGLFYSVSQFLIKPFFLQSSESAKSFMKQASDPMARIKRHFELLVDNVETSGYRLAIFIDDLDRCSTSFTVQLLEGIQTLYKDRKVLYLVAGDRKWISACFENHYTGFEKVIEEPSQKLGYLFLEKAFQLSIRLPQITPKVKEEYWNFILDPNGERKLKLGKVQTASTEKRSTEEKDELKTRFRERFDKKQYSSPDQVEKISGELGLSDAEATDYTLELLNENQEDIKHRLQGYSNLIEANPRSIKRLANQYNIYRDTLIAERRSFDADKLFRWLILQNCYPNYTDCVEKNGKIYMDDKLPKVFEGLKQNTHWTKLISGDNKKDRLEIEDILMFVGREIEGAE